MKVHKARAHHALQGGVGQGRPVPVEVGPHVQTGTQQVHSREGAGHGAQVVVQVAVGVVARGGKSRCNMEKLSSF